MSTPPNEPEQSLTHTQEPATQSLLGFPQLARLLPWKAPRPGHASTADAAAGPILEAPSHAPPKFTAPEQAFLLHLARRALQRAATAGEPLPVSGLEDCPPRLVQPAACFVTLTRKGELRGCVGSVQAREPLCQAVARSACNAALFDSRFPAVTADEVDQLRIEVSVLSEPVPLSFSSPEELLSQLQPFEHGVVLRSGSRVATFLPKVWEQLADKAEFLNHLSEKAGCAPAAWRAKDVSVSVYHVESFAES